VFVRHLGATLSPEEKERLTEAAQQLGNRLELSMPGPLVSPDKLLDEAAGC
jgi:hypothetical protein